MDLNSFFANAKRETLRALLSENTRERVEIVRRYKAHGGKAVLSSSDLDLIQEALRAGKVVHYSPCLDSTGYVHQSRQVA